FDTAWDVDSQRLVVADNGPVGGDEIHVINEGAYCGWPFAYGHTPPVFGGVEPDFVFDDTVAPTGIVRLNGANPFLRRGYLIGAFMTKSIYYFADLDVHPIPEPVTLLDHEAGFIIDVAQSADGDLYFTNGEAIFRLRTPARGDCNGDGLANAADLPSLSLELADGGPHPALDAPNGSYRGSWGCDADGDGMIQTEDVPALAKLIHYRQRAIGR
ncbi:MAG TPA: PQQ-dependent sugar dehydrogenase, partial [Thermoanaerobaculia bacterium]|nr:PQQ-dependent sugar dehydrogenase [Thermoanaerobaculia bacterium]